MFATHASNASVHVDTQDLDEAQGEANELRMEVQRLAGEIGALSGQLGASRAESLAAQATAQHLVQENAASCSALEKVSAPNTSRPARGRNVRAQSSLLPSLYYTEFYKLF